MKHPAVPVAAGLAGVAGLLALWEIAGRLHLLGPSWPACSATLAYAAVPEHRALLLAAALQTLGEAAAGYALGAVAGCACALVAVLLPPAAPGIERLAAMVNGIPIIAVGSICSLTFPAAVNPIVVAALAVFFMLFVAATAGLSAMPPVSRDLFAILGASRWTTFARLRLPSAIPAIADGLRLSAPVSVVGAIIGEWFAAERGLGPLLVNAMQNYQIELLWAAAAAGAGISTIAYLGLGYVERAAVRRYRA